MLTHALALTAGALVLHGYWRFLRMPALQKEAERRREKLEEECAALARKVSACEERFDWFAGKTEDVVYAMS